MELFLFAIVQKEVLVDNWISHPAELLGGTDQVPSPNGWQAWGPLQVTLAMLIKDKWKAIIDIVIQICIRVHRIFFYSIFIWLTLFSLYFLILRTIYFLTFFDLRPPSFAKFNFCLLMGNRRNFNGKLFDFEYYVGIWFEYDRFGFNLSRPSLGSPLMVWCTEINSSDTFWPFPKCLKMVTFGEIGHFGAIRKWPKCITGIDFSASNHQGWPQWWSR